MRGGQMKTQHRYKVKIKFVLFKSNCPRRDDQFQSCRKRKVAEGSTISPTLALPRPNETNIHECLSSGRQKCGSHKAKYRGCTEDVEVFPSQISQAYPSPDWQYGDESYHAEG